MATCTIYTIQRCRPGEPGEAMVIAGEESNGVTIFDFFGGEIAETADEFDVALDFDLLATLVDGRGRSSVCAPSMRVAFRTAPH